MVHIVSETIGKEYYCLKLSRTFVVVNLIYLTALVIPILILASIGAGWPSYIYSTQQPTLTYSDYELSCNTVSGSPIYYSSFSSQMTTSSSISVSSAPVSTSGTIPSRYIITFQLIDTEVQSCNAMVYFTVNLQRNTKYQFVGITNFYFYAPQTSANTYVINQANATAQLKIKLVNPLQQSSVLNTQYSSPYFDPIQFSMPYNLINYNRNNISVITSNPSQTNKFALSGSSTQPTIRLDLYIQQQQIVYQASLVTQFREFLRRYIYIAIPLWVVSVALVRWIIGNNIYPSRIQNSYSFASKLE